MQRNTYESVLELRIKFYTIDSIEIKSLYNILKLWCLERCHILTCNPVGVGTLMRLRRNRFVDLDLTKINHLFIYCSKKNIPQ